MTFETKLRAFVRMTKTSELSKIELEKIAEELLRLYNEERKVYATQWQGKSSFAFNEVGDNIIVTKFQKPEKGAEPKEIHTKIRKSEFNRLHYEIMKYFTTFPDKEYFKSKRLAEHFYAQDWKEIFNNRKRHNKFTLMLNVLDKKGIIIYRGGRVYKCKQ